MAGLIPTKTPHPFGLNRALLLRRAAIAPLCLCLVAAVHAVRVVACNQTQWKGGGFGMFSTIDSESARFVRAFGCTSQGELPLEIPSHLAKAVAEARAAPTQTKLDSLAQRLASIRWRRPDERMVAIGRRLADQPDGQLVSAQTLDQASWSLVALPLPSNGLPRVLAAVPSDEASAAAIGVSAIRVECWTLSLDGSSATLQSVKLGEATAEITVEAMP